MQQVEPRSPCAWSHHSHLHQTDPIHACFLWRQDPWSSASARSQIILRQRRWRMEARHVEEVGITKRSQRQIVVPPILICRGIAWGWSCRGRFGHCQWQWDLLDSFHHARMFQRDSSNATAWHLTANGDRQGRLCHLTSHLCLWRKEE